MSCEIKKLKQVDNLYSDEIQSFVKAWRNELNIKLKWLLLVTIVLAILSAVLINKDYTSTLSYYLGERVPVTLVKNLGRDANNSKDFLLEVLAEDARTHVIKGSVNLLRDFNGNKIVYALRYKDELFSDEFRVTFTMVGILLLLGIMLYIYTQKVDVEKLIHANDFLKDTRQYEITSSQTAVVGVKYHFKNAGIMGILSRVYVHSSQKAVIDTIQKLEAKNELEYTQRTVSGNKMITMIYYKFTYKGWEYSGFSPTVENDQLRGGERPICWIAVRKNRPQYNIFLGLKNGADVED